MTDHELQFVLLAFKIVVLSLTSDQNFIFFLSEFDSGSPLMFINLNV